MGPCVSEKQRETVSKYVEIGKAEGAKLLCGGEKLTEGKLSKGWFLSRRRFSPTRTRGCGWRARRSSAP